MDLVLKMLAWDPLERLGPQEALHHTWFKINEI